MIPKVSVIVPIYNSKPYLMDTLSSISKQTLYDIEIICVDDGSSDGSQDIVTYYMEKDQRIQLIKETNHGAGHARNLGIDRAKGEYIAFMDSDDKYPDDKVLEDLYVSAKENMALIGGGSFSEFDDVTGNACDKYDNYLWGYTFNRSGFIEYKDYQFDYGYHRFIYKRDFLKTNKLYFPEYRRFQDPPFFVKTMITAGKFYTLNRNTYAYRRGHQKIKWDGEKIVGLLNGIKDNLSISSDHGYEDLHAITVQRLIENKSIFLNRELICDSVVYAQLIEILYSIRHDLIANSKYQINMNEIFEIYNRYIIELNSEKDRADRLQQLNADIKNSETFKLGKAILYIPRQLYLVLKNKL